MTLFHSGCSLQEPLASMTASKHYKTMDIIGYLKSVLEDAKPYARMKLMVVGVQVQQGVFCLFIIPLENQNSEMRGLFQPQFVQGIGKTTLLEHLRGEGGSYRRTKQVGDNR